MPITWKNVNAGTGAVGANLINKGVAGLNQALTDGAQVVDDYVAEDKQQNDDVLRGLAAKMNLDELSDPNARAAAQAKLAASAQGNNNNVSQNLLDNVLNDRKTGLQSKYTADAAYTDFKNAEASEPVIEKYKTMKINGDSGAQKYLNQNEKVLTDSGDLASLTQFGIQQDDLIKQRQITAKTAKNASALNAAKTHAVNGERDKAQAIIDANKPDFDALGHTSVVAELINVGELRKSDRKAKMLEIEKTSFADTITSTVDNLVNNAGTTVDGFKATDTNNFNAALSNIVELDDMKISFNPDGSLNQPPDISDADFKKVSDKVKKVIKNFKGENPTSFIKNQLANIKNAKSVNGFSPAPAEIKRAEDALTAQFLPTPETNQILFNEHQNALGINERLNPGMASNPHYQDLSSTQSADEVIKSLINEEMLKGWKQENESFMGSNSNGLEFYDMWGDGVTKERFIKLAKEGLTEGLQLLDGEGKPKGARYPLPQSAIPLIAEIVHADYIEGAGDTTVNEAFQQYLKGSTGEYKKFIAWQDGKAAIDRKYSIMAASGNTRRIQISSALTNEELRRRAARKPPPKLQPKPDLIKEKARLEKIKKLEKQQQSPYQSGFARGQTEQVLKKLKAGQYK